MIDAREEFAVRLRAAMDRRGYRIKDLVEESGLSKVTISRYLRSIHSPGLTELYLLCEALGVSSYDLLGF